ncbi:MAG: aspartate-semialdehyde dehydrogenase [Acidobacteria bacterium]|jgi:aspartate-semialdehyde dehydrogenase|nr:aspartate-semialdehyde dehydrogenase [Acidobacteriota bacterium]
MKKIKVAVLGCTGLVGGQFVRLLDDHPYFELSCLTASAGSAGKRFGETLDHRAAAGMSAATRGLAVGATTVEAVLGSGARIVFSALPGSIAGELEAELRRRGAFVFSNAGAHRMDPAVPLLIPEANPGHLELARAQLREFPGFIVTNPNCVVAGLALALKPLTALALQAVTVTTFQAVSGGGRRGVAAWDIMGNVVPFIAHEEEKIGRETKKILGTLEQGQVHGHDLEIYPSCSRVAVRDGHLQSVSVEFARPVGLPEIRETLAGFAAAPQQMSLPTAPLRPLIVHQGSDRPQPALDADAGEPARARGMAVTVGRFRQQGTRCSFFLLVHNTVRGAAGGSVLNAELAVRSGLITGREA